MILKERGIEWRGGRAVARDREKWKTVCKPLFCNHRESLHSVITVHHFIL
jgi:hypothetical protein